MISVALLIPVMKRWAQHSRFSQRARHATDDNADGNPRSTSVSGLNEHERLSLDPP